MSYLLAVYLFDRRVGDLALVEGRLQFCYCADWLQHADAVPLSCSLPLQVEVFNDQQTRPFFAGLLPEGKLRQLIARQFQVSKQNDFALLNHIGGECAGAVSLLSPDRLPAVSEPANEIDWLSDSDILALLDELPQRPMLAGQDGFRLSLAGAQDKLPVVFDGQRIGLPRNGTPSSHILKPAIAAVEDSVINEGFCLALAGAMQFQTAQSRICAIRDRSFLLVERYDRTQAAIGQRLRLHQEDFCQALGIVPELKYQNEGGPGLDQCFDLVRRVTRPSAPQVLRLLDAVIFNALIGNHDAHAKNFSILYADKCAVLAPLYDVLSTAVYPSLTPKMAMQLGGKYKFSEVQARHWDRFAQAAGLSVAQTRKRILGLCQRLPLVARTLQASADHDFVGNPAVEQIVQLIEQRAALTVRRLNDKT
ncbi:type II toxin-antitoxin system HipA family toxin [Methylomonas sp. UP202]|uniref:type II toxin-antitoxin system HipA family toxin n=1 Tax=Methylomonas sp. UP202 TaxID=3040943 RepID=UPI0024789651|nr:type II toxin-antitoxin system HipA family toxin [Methylomonas sp. UP202]WGS88125.1 type II toxin-antitoxin system HipA family toxin [Methylomonas sp. UP202]